MKTLAQNSPWLTVREIGIEAKCGPRLVYSEIRAGRLRAARIGGRRAIRSHRDWVTEWLTACAEPNELRR
jgi:hypothetical protein